MTLSAFNGLVIVASWALFVVFLWRSILVRTGPTKFDEGVAIALVAAWIGRMILYFLKI